jgi:hypothetical protein
MTLPKTLKWAAVYTLQTTATLIIGVLLIEAISKLP